MSDQAFVVLFAGINVGGNRLVKMAELKALLEATSLQDVRTYVQSGNAIARAAGTETELARLVEDAFEQKFGFRSRVFVRSLKRWEALIAANPFPDVEAEPTRLHAYLLERAPTGAEITALKERDSGPDRWVIDGGVLYLHTPDGMGKSKFAGTLPRWLKVAGTARNWRTVLTLAEMARTG